LEASKRFTDEASTPDGRAMAKVVVLAPHIYGWLHRHPFISAEVIISAVADYPSSNRKLIGKNRFRIVFNRTKTGKPVTVTLSVEEKETIFLVFGAHCATARR
jgi:hypothetical protein